MKRRRLRITNKLGLHARPAAEFVRCARRFKCTIRILRRGEEFSASSIIEVLTASLDFGAEAELVADGPDASEALEELVRLVRSFGERGDE